MQEGGDLTTKKTRIFCILIIAGIPIFISGLFVYRNPFPAVDPVTGASIHLARDVFLGASLPTGLAANAVLLGIHAPLSSIWRRDASHQHSTLALSLTAIATISVLWAAIIVTEVLIRSRSLALWDMYIRNIQLMSTSSIVLGILASVAVLLLGIHPRMNLQAA